MALHRLGLPTALAAIVIFFPGFAAILLLPRRIARDLAFADRVALAPCAGILLVTLGWWLADPLGIRVTYETLEIAFGAIGLLIIGGLVRHIRLTRKDETGPGRGSRDTVSHISANQGHPAAPPHPPCSAGIDCAWLIVVFVAALVLRLAVVRDLALPAWVDGVHHTYIANLLIAHGGIPTDYGPLLGFGPFAYHFGFHAIVATVAIVGSVESADSVIATGQLLSACAALTAYFTVRLYRGSPRQAIAAATLASLVSFMPAYFVSWSRFTQLSGLIAVPAWLFIARMSGRGPYAAIAAGVASAALLFVHPRVAVMAAAWGLADVAMHQASWHKQWKWLPLAGIAAVLVAAPWLVRVLGELVPRLGVAVEGVDVANEITLAAVSAGNDPYLYALAAAGLVGGLLFTSRAAWVALVWMVLVAIAANPGRVGLPGTYLMSNGAVLISLWLPASCLAGAGVCAVGTRVVNALPRLQLTRVLPLVAPMLIIAALAMSGSVQSSLNPTTVLATAADRRALERMRLLIPNEAPVAVNVRVWQLGTYMGTDAGYWIGVVAPGRSIVPPLLYGLGPVDRARGISERLAAWESAMIDADAIVTWMREQGIVWLFIGERGGPIDATQLTPARGFELVLEESTARLWKLRLNG